MMRNSRAPTGLAVVAFELSVIVLSAACAGTTSAPSSSTAVPKPAAPPAAASAVPRTITEPYAPTIDPSAFSFKVDNPYFPLKPGTRTIYEAATPDGLQRTTTEVTRDTKRIMGVDTAVVHDFLTLNGKLIEDTLDWYAQDRDGNVWYFGEATKEFAEGAADTKGSFEGGVGGALPGILMPGHPVVGDQYRQEYAKGVAEDTGEVLSLTGSETTPLTGPVQNLLITKDFDLLDPGAPAENKYYARGVGLVLTIAGGEREQAIAVEKF
jgi:hypothetical protein